MNKQKKQMLALVLVLVVLVAGYFGLQQYNKLQSEKESSEPKNMLTDIDSDEIIKLSYTYEGEEYRFYKEDDTWLAEDDPTQSLMQYRITNLVSKAAQLEAVNTIENVTDMSQYGLSEPTRSISFETESASYIFYVGDYNSMSGVYYLCRPSDDTVYTVENSTIISFSYTWDDLIEEEEETADESAEETAEESADAE